MHVMHRRKLSGEEKVDLWFACDKWHGTPHNSEPEKCDDLDWFPLEGLPPNTVAYVQATLMLINNGQQFSVFYDQTLLHVSGDDLRIRPAAAWERYL